MKFTVSRLCGGKALMAAPKEDVELDLGAAEKILSEKGYEIRQNDGLMLVFTFEDMETTLYVQGKVMFFPLNDKTKCVDYANSILECVL